MQITFEELKRVCPRGRARFMRPFVKVFNAEAHRFGIKSERAGCHFIAQCCQETDGFKTYTEYHDGSNYEGAARLGNNKPGDGKKFPGHGALMLTGRENHTKAGRALGLPLAQKPLLAAQPVIGTRTALWYWKSRRLTRYAERNNIRRITKLINGGFNGYSDRKAYFRRAWAEWGRERRGMESTTRRAAIGAGVFAGVGNISSFLADLTDISYSVVEMGVWAIAIFSLAGLAGCIWWIWRERNFKMEAFGE